MKIYFRGLCQIFLDLGFPGARATAVTPAVSLHAHVVVVTMMELSRKSLLLQCFLMLGQVPIRRHFVILGLGGRGCFLAEGRVAAFTVLWTSRLAWARAVMNSKAAAADPPRPLTGRGGFSGSFVNVARFFIGLRMSGMYFPQNMRQIAAEVHHVCICSCQTFGGV